jgi:formylglycine-generating enzyme required for sulfatase activity
MTRVAEGLDATCPKLATILRAQPQGQPPLLVVVYAWCLRRRIEGDSELARGLQFERLNALHRDLGAGLGRLIPLLDQLPAALADLGDIRDGVGRLEAGNAVVKAQVGEVNERLKRLGGTRGPADPRLSRSIRDGEEVAAVRALLDRMRALSPDQRRAVPDLIAGLGKLALGVGDFGAAQGLFRDLAEAGDAAEGPADRPVAGRPGGPDAIAEAHYNAYLAALGAKDWPAALTHLRQAVDLDPARFAPFSFHEYPPIRILGAGGFGAAFLCQELLDKPPLVIKALHDDQSDQGLREGRVLAQLDHPHIVRVQRVGYAQGKRRPYLVMDYFEGSEGLDTYIKAHGCLPAARVRDLGLALASALVAAHAKGILHRDINPANILIRDGGDCPVKLIDFGLAAEVPPPDAAPADSPSPSLSPATLVRTHDFSAPEAKGQLPGVPIGPRSDLYSLGATLSYCLCREPKPSRKQWAALELEDKDLADILERCLEHDPAQRWPSAQALHEALNAAVLRDQADWEAATRADTVAAYDAYLSGPAPVRRHLDEAHARVQALKAQHAEAAAQADTRRAEAQRDQAAWAQAQPKGTVAAYRAYLADETLPRAHAREALAAIADLELRARDDRAWAEAERQGTVAACRAYLADESLPRAHAQEARALMDRVEAEARKHRDDQAWAQALAADSLEGYRAYLADATLLRSHAEEARAGIARIEARAAEARRQAAEAERLRGEQALREGDDHASGRRRVGIVGAVLAVEVLVVGGFAYNSHNVEVERRELQAAAKALPLIADAMVEIPTGSFQMGCSPGDGACYADEKPPHPVKVPGFRMGKTEVTQAQWRAAMGENPSYFKGDDRPVEQVSWDDARAFLKRLNAGNPGKPYRLPSEAEWEYAARAGTTTPYWWGKDLGKGNANCAECGSQWDKKETAPVVSFKANPFGLFDTTGNVWEWVQDCWHDSCIEAPADGSQWHDNCPGARRVLRGGSWSTNGGSSRVSNRNGNAAGSRGLHLGLRLAQDL